MWKSITIYHPNHIVRLVVCWFSKKKKKKKKEKKEKRLVVYLCQYNLSLYSPITTNKGPITNIMAKQ